MSCAVPTIHTGSYTFDMNYGIDNFNQKSLPRSHKTFHSYFLKHQKCFLDINQQAFLKNSVIVPSRKLYNNTMSTGSPSCHDTRCYWKFCSCVDQSNVSVTRPFLCELHRTSRGCDGSNVHPERSGQAGCRVVWAKRGFHSVCFGSVRQSGAKPVHQCLICNVDPLAIIRA